MSVTSSQKMKVPTLHKDPVAIIRGAFKKIEFHVLFKADGGPVQECLITASCLLECEAKLKEIHPEAVYWEIGM